MIKGKYVTQKIAFSLFGASVVLIVTILMILLGYIIYHGFGALSFEFFTQPPRNGMTEGGILQPLVGTLYLMGLTALISLPLGTMSAIYLTEYAGKNAMTSLIHHAINNLAGVPSIVFGLFGLAFFVKFMGFGISILSGALTLSIVILPTLIRTAEEAIKAVPTAFREASYALGATKWYTIRHVVLPAALPGMLTGSILGLGRAAGETAPILFTAAAYYLPRLPRGIFDSTMALPYHLYVISTSGLDIQGTVHLQYGSALTLLIIVLSINMVAILIRVRVGRRKKW